MPGGFTIRRAARIAISFSARKGLGVVGASSSGDIHIIDVSNISNPVDVGFIHVPGAGTAQLLDGRSEPGALCGVLQRRRHQGRRLRDAERRHVEPDRGAGAAGRRSGEYLHVGRHAERQHTLRRRYGQRLLGARPGDARHQGRRQQRARPLHLRSLGVGAVRLYRHLGNGKQGTNNSGNAVKIWALGANGVPTLADSIIIPNLSTVSDVAVSPDGRALVFGAESGNGPATGVYVYSLVSNPAKPTFAAYYPVTPGIHTTTVAVVNGRTYVFAARDPGNVELDIFDITDVVH